MQKEHTEGGMFDTTVENFEISKTMLKLISFEFGFDCIFVISMSNYTG